MFRKIGSKEVLFAAIIIIDSVFGREYPEYFFKNQKDFKNLVGPV